MDSAVKQVQNVESVSSLSTSSIDQIQSKFPFSYCYCTSHGALTPHIMFSRSEKYIATERENW